MTAVADIRAGLVANLRGVPGLRVYDHVPGQVAIPAALVAPGTPFIEYESATGATTYLWDVFVLVGTAVSREAQDRLDQHAAPTGTDSIRQAVESDSTLDGAAHDVAVLTCDAYDAVDFGGVTYLGAKWTVSVLA